MDNYREKIIRGYNVDRETILTLADGVKFIGTSS